MSMAGVARPTASGWCSISGPNDSVPAPIVSLAPYPCDTPTPGNVSCSSRMSSGGNGAPPELIAVTHVRS